ncbi:hypothetical protein ACN47E_005203 [Coniothyrium glycines]
MNTALLACFLFISTVLSAPLTTNLVSGMAAQSSVRPPRGDTASSRASYTAISLLCMSLLSGIVGFRLRLVDRRHLRGISWAHFLIFVLCFFSMAFVLSAAIIESGLSLATEEICHGAISICLAFYTGSKVTVYLFLVERTHALRAPYACRYRDWMWLVGTFVTLGGFSIIALLGYMWPVAELSEYDRRCRIGLRQYVTIPLLTFDIVLNIALTIVFVHLLSPLICTGQFLSRTLPASRLLRCLDTLCSRTKTRGSVNLHCSNQRLVQKMEYLVWKTFIGSILIMIPTLGNLITLLILKGSELGWICLTVCTLDVTWQVVVFNWLTMGGNEGKEVPSGSTSRPRASARDITRVPTPLRLKPCRDMSRIPVALATLDANHRTQRQSLDGSSAITETAFAESTQASSVRMDNFECQDSNQTTLISNSST